MAFHSPNPIQFQFLSRYQLFWRHGIKNRKGLNARDVWKSEKERISQWVSLRTSHVSFEEVEGDKNVFANSLAFTEDTDTPKWRYLFIFGGSSGSIGYWEPGN